MNPTMAPNVSGVGAPGRRTVYSMCGMCAVRCPIEVTVEDGRVTWLQGNPHDKAIGASLCAKGSAGLALEYDDDQRPQTPLIRMGSRGGGQWRRASWDEALDYIAGKLHETIEEFGARGIALSDRGGPFNDLTRTFVRALGSPNYFNHDAGCGGNVHNAARSLYGFGHEGLIPDLARVKHLVLYGRNIVESLMVKEAKAFMAAVANGMRVTYIDPRATITASKATRYWQVRPKSDYALNLAIIHEVLKREAYDKDFVAGFVSGMDELREAVKDTTPEWQERHTGVPADELRAFVTEIAAEAPQVIFHPGWMSARHEQSFYVSRSALILNALMGNIELPGGFVLGKPPALYGRKGLNHLTDRAPSVDEPRVDGAGTARPQWDPAIGMVHQAFAAMETGKPYGIGAYFAYRHDPFTGLPDPEATPACAGQAEADRLDRRALFGDGLVCRRHPARVDLPRTRQYPLRGGPSGAGLRHARPGDRAALRQPPGLVDLPGDPPPDGHQGGARLRDHRGALELSARRHRCDRRRDARGRNRRSGGRTQADPA